MRGTCQPTTYQGHCRQNARAYLQGKDLRRQYPCLITDGRIFEGKRLGKHVLPCVVPLVTRPYRPTDYRSGGGTLDNSPIAGTTFTTGHRQVDF